MASFRDSEIDKVDAGAPHTETAASATTSSVKNHGIESSSDDVVDDNYRVFKATADLEVDPAEAKRVVSKIDWRVVTILFGTYLLQYLDKSE